MTSTLIRSKNIFLVLACLIGFASVNASAELTDFIQKPVSLSYNSEGKISGMSYSATSYLDWVPNNSQYQLTLKTDISIFYTFEQKSTGTFGAQGIHPVKYSEGKKAAKFNYKDHLISFYKEKDGTAKLLRQAQDRLSAIFHLSFLLKNKPDLLDNNKTISFQIAGPRNAAIWTFANVKSETINAIGKQFKTLLVEKIASSDGKNRQLRLWLAPELNYFPVRMEFSKENGDRVLQELKSASL